MRVRSDSTVRWLAGAALIAAVGFLAWILGHGLRGLLYLALYAAATVPGWPVGWRLFGRDHAAGWVAGALVGYALTCWMLWAVLWVRLGSAPAFVIGWLVLTAIAGAAARRAGEPLVRLPAWTRRDTAALLLFLLVVPAMVGPAFRNIGATDAAGNRYYRSYFTADFVWHMALTAELARFELPPKNPYLQGERLNYYWTYFLVPAAVAGAFPRVFGHEYAPWLTINATCAGMLFVAALFVSTWCTVPKRGAAAAATAAALLAASAEGAYLLFTFWRDGVPWAEVRNFNVDAVTLWLFNGLTIDGLPRSLWYTPQHAGACAFGLMALAVAGSDPASLRVAAPALAGVFLAGAVTFSPFLGAAFSVLYGATAIVSALVASPRTLVPSIARHAAAALPAGGAVLACVSAGMMGGGAAPIAFGWAGLARHAPVVTMLLALGPLLALAGPALLRPRRWPTPMIGAGCSVAAGVLLFYFARLADRDPVWMGWRAGQILLVSLPPFAALTLARAAAARPWPRRAAWSAYVAALLIGLPTTALDAYNVQDIANTTMGPGFRWTLVVTPAEQEALRWLREHTSLNQCVQFDTSLRGAEGWTTIPTFAQRRLCGGMPLSLLHIEEYDRRADRAHTVFWETDAVDAWAQASRARIDYLYVGLEERAGVPAESLRKFDVHPELFAPVFRNDAVAIYHVVPE